MGEKETEVVERVGMMFSDRARFNEGVNACMPTACLQLNESVDVCLWMRYLHELCGKCRLHAYTYYSDGVCVIKVNVVVPGLSVVSCYTYEVLEQKVTTEKWEAKRNSLRILLEHSSLLTMK